MDAKMSNIETPEEAAARNKSERETLAACGTCPDCIMQAARILRGGR